MFPLFLLFFGAVMTAQDTEVRLAAFIKLSEFQKSDPVKLAVEQWMKRPENRDDLAVQEASDEKVNTVEEPLFRGNAENGEKKSFSNTRLPPVFGGANQERKAVWWDLLTTALHPARNLIILWEEPARSRRGDCRRGSGADIADATDGSSAETAAVGGCNGIFKNAEKEKNR